MPHGAIAPSHPAPLTVVVEGRWITVGLGSADDTVGDLLGVVGVESASGRAAVDGRAVDTACRLVDSGIVHGSIVGAWDASSGHVPAGRAQRTPAVGPSVVCEAGPAVTAPVALKPGRMVVGRVATAGVPLADPDIEPHLGVFDVADDGRCRFTQVTGRIPIRVRGNAVAGTVELGNGDGIEIGATHLRVGDGPAGDRPAALRSPPNPWRRIVDRQPRRQPEFPSTVITAPDVAAQRARTGTGGLVAALLGAVGSTAVAFVLHNPLFLVFSAVALMVAGGSALSTRVGARRVAKRDGQVQRIDRASFLDDVERHASRWARAHRLSAPGPAEALRRIAAVDHRLWARRSDHVDSGMVVLGHGALTCPSPVRGSIPAELSMAVAERLRVGDGPVVTAVGSGSALAISGPLASAVVRSVVVQLAALEGPADRRFVIVADRPHEWTWCRALPHATGPSGGALLVAADDRDALALVLDGLDDRPTVVVTDRADVLAARTGPVRRFVAERESAAVICQLGAGHAVPAMCHQVLEIGSLGRAAWSSDVTSPGGEEPVQVAGMTVTTAAEACRMLAPLIDPEDDTNAAAAIPVSVTLGELSLAHGTGPIDDAIAVAAAWRRGGDDVAPAAVIGVTADGVIDIDLVRDGPHALVGGTTGSGKSELLRTLVVSLAARCSPEQIAFVLVDYKGGATFDACANLPHTVGVVTDLDERLASRALASLDAELRHRERLLRDVGASDLTAYRATPDHEPLPRLVVVVDEFAALVSELPQFVPSLVGIAQRGRSLGVHLVLATQRPSGVVSDDIRANTNLRLALRLPDAADARDIVGVADPVEFPRSVPGRAMTRLGPGDVVTFQAASSSGAPTAWEEDTIRVMGSPGGRPVDGPSELSVLVRTIGQAASLCDIGAAHRVWQPALPERLPLEVVVSTLGHDVASSRTETIGLVDDPPAQRRAPLAWARARGNLAVVGAVGSGVSTTLAALAAAAGRGAGADVYVIDGPGDPRYDDLTHEPWCGGVVRVHESERLRRLIRHGLAEIGARQRARDGSYRRDMVLVIDGAPTLWAALDDACHQPHLDALRRILSDGQGVGVNVVVAVDRPSSLAPGVLAACGQRWVMHLSDPTESALLGVAPGAVPARVPGRLVVAGSAGDAQVAVDVVEAFELSEVDVSTNDRRHRAPRIGMLPDVVDGNDLPAGRVGARGDVELPVGIGDEDLDVAWLPVPDGDHLTVVGPSRSGRSSTLAWLRRTWTRDVAAPSIVVCGSPRSPLLTDAMPIDDAVDAVTEARGRVLLVVDDADRVDDPRGVMAALVAESRPGLLVVVAGRPDALRTSYGHWTAAVRRSRRGIVLAASDDADGELLGVVLPRHRPVPARPGLAYVIADGDRRLVQLALSPPAS